MGLAHAPAPAGPEATNPMPTKTIAHSGSSLGLASLGQVTVDRSSAFACLLLLLAPVALVGLLVPAGQVHNHLKRVPVPQQRLCMSGAALYKAHHDVITTRCQALAPAQSFLV